MRRSGEVYLNQNGDYYLLTWLADGRWVLVNLKSGIVWDRPGPLPRAFEGGEFTYVGRLASVGEEQWKLRR